MRSGMFEMLDNLRQNIRRYKYLENNQFKKTILYTFVVNEEPLYFCPINHEKKRLELLN